MKKLARVSLSVYLLLASLPLVFAATTGRSDFLTANTCLFSAPSLVEDLRMGVPGSNPSWEEDFMCNAGADNATSICEAFDDYDGDTVEPNPAPSIDLDDLRSPDSDPGGVWAQTGGPTSVTIDGGNIVDFNADPAAPGVYTFTYTIPADGTCAGSVATMTIEVSEFREAGGTNLFVQLCEGDNTLINLMGGRDAGGTWTQLTGPPSMISFADPTNVDFSGAAPGNYRFRYEHASQGSCPGDIGQATVSISADIFDAGSSGALTLCEGENTSVDLYSIISGESPDLVPSVISSTGVLNPGGATDSLGGGKARFDDIGDVMKLNFTTYTINANRVIQFQGTAFGGGATLEISGTTSIPGVPFSIPYDETFVAAGNGTFNFTFVAPFTIGSFDLKLVGGGGYDLDYVHIGGDWTETTSGTPSGLTLDDPTHLNFSGVAAGTYEFTYTILGDDICTAVLTSTATIIIGPNVAPTVDGGAPLYLCTDNTPIMIGGSPTATPGTGTTLQYSWDFPELLDNATLANPTATLSESTTFTVTVTDELGCSNTGQSAVYLIPAADAGPDVFICEGQGTKIGTPGPAGNNQISYQWSPATGLSCTDCAQPIANPAVATTYTLNISFQDDNSSNCSFSDQVLVTPVSAPAAGFAGTDQVICKDQTVLIGVSNDPTYTYTWTPGVGLDAYNQGTATVLATTPILPIVDPITYNLTAVEGDCSFTDQVEIAIIEARAGEDGCGPRIIGEPDRTPNINETYTWTLVSGPDILTGPNNTPQTSVAGSQSETSIYELEVCFGGTCCTDQVVIPPCGCLVEIEPEVPGCPFFNGAEPVRLIARASDIYSADPDDFIYNWTPMEGLNTYTGYKVQLTDNEPRTYTVTMLSPYDPSFMCTAMINVNDPNYVVPTFMAQDGAFCTGQTVNIGEPNIAGYSYAWQGPSGFTSTISNPAVGTAGTYYVTVTDVVTGCLAVDTATVINSSPVAQAGADWLVCDGATIVLGSADPSGGQWTYQWSPTTGLDNPNIAQPTLLATTDQTYTLTVTSLASGCMVTDAVMVDVEPNLALEDAPDVTICAGQSIQIGPAAISGVQYSWSPTSGLSCSDCARPTASPSGTITYTLTAIFPGCATPVTDDVMVTVGEVTIDLGPDIAYCPADGGVNIGGNVPTGLATYTWSPSSNLDNNTIPNPFSTTPFTRTYTLVVTDANGCSDSDQIRVAPLLSAEAGFGGTICLGESRTFGNFNNSGTLSWSPTTDLDDPASPRPVFTPTSAGTFTYTLTQDIDGCISTDQVTITVNPAPPPINLGPDISYCPADGGVNIGDNAPAGLNSYTWAPNLYLNSNTIPNPVSTAPVLTNYILTGRDGNNCITRDTIAVIPTNNAPEAGSSTSICLGESIQLGDPTNTGIISWSPATDLDAPDSPTPLFTSTSTGTFTYTVMQTNNACSTTDQVTITVIGVDNIGAFDQNASVCMGGCVTIGPSAQPGLVYSWSPITGLNTPNNAQTVACVSQNTVYTLTVFDPVTGCSRSEMVNVTIAPGTAPMVEVDPIDVCLGGTGQFAPQISPVGTYNYAWSPGSGLDNPLIANPMVFGGSIGTQTYELTVTDPANNCATIVQATVNVNDGSDVGAVITSGSVDCNNNEVSFTTNITGVYASLQWSSGGDGTFVPNANNPNAIYEPGASDLANQSVTIGLEVIGQACGNLVSDELVVSLSNCALPPTDLAITKIVDNATPNYGDNVTFTLEAINNGPWNASGVMVNDLLPVGFTYVSDNSGGAYSGASGAWMIGNLNVGQSVSIQITAAVDGVGDFLNVARITGDQPDYFLPNNEASEEIFPVFPPLIVDILCSETTFDLTSITIENQPSGTIITYHDAQPPTLLNQLVDPTMVGAGTYYIAFYDSMDDCFSGTTQVTVNPPQPCEVDLAIVKTVDQPSVLINTDVVFTLIVANNGPDPATGVTVNDLLPAGLTYVSHVVGSGSYVPGTGVWTIGDLAVGGGTTLLITATATPTAIPMVTNTATVTGNEPDPDLTNNTDDAMVSVFCYNAPLLSVGAVSCVDGSTYEYSFTASPGATVVSANGTISGNTVTVAVGTNDVLTAYNGDPSCPSLSLSVTSPADCNIMCEQPDLTLGNSVCENGTTYAVSFTETTGATITASAGTITGNVVSGIPVGTDVVITATNASDAACAISLTAISPVDCTTPCPDELLSVSALGECAADGLTYSVNFVLSAGATLSADFGTIDMVNSMVTGIPAGQAVTLTATNAGCNLVDDIVVAAPVCLPPFVKLNLKVRLQGPLLGNETGLMRDDLRARDLIPAIEPYTGMTNFMYIGTGGGETVLDPVTVFADLGSNSIVDWVFVELRSAANPAMVVDTRAGLLQRDGDVVDVDGVSSLCFTQSTNADYYVAIRHRNHLGTMTANPLPLTSEGTVVDFTDTGLELWNNQANFNNREQVTIAGQYALWAGNTTSDDRVVYAGQVNDRDPIFNAVDGAAGNFFKIQTYILPGYNNNDVDLDGDTIYAGQGNDVDPIFNNVDGHLANIFKIQTFIILEQLAK